MSDFEDRKMCLPDTCRYCKHCMPVRSPYDLSYYCMLGVTKDDYKVIVDGLKSDEPYSNEFYHIMKMIDESLSHSRRLVDPYQRCQFFDGGGL